MNVDNLQHIFTLAFKYERRGYQNHLDDFQHSISLQSCASSSLSSHLRRPIALDGKLFSNEEENKMKTRVNWEQVGLVHIPLDCTSKCEMYLSMTEMGIDIIGGDVVPFLSAYCWGIYQFIFIT